MKNVIFAAMLVLATTACGGPEMSQPEDNQAAVQAGDEGASKAYTTISGTTCTPPADMDSCEGGITGHLCKLVPDSCAIYRDSAGNAHGWNCNFDCTTRDLTFYHYQECSPMVLTASPTGAPAGQFRVMFVCPLNNQPS